MVVAVIWIGFKSMFMCVNGSIHSNRDVPNLDRFGFIEALDEKHGTFGWILQQDGAPADTTTRTQSARGERRSDCELARELRRFITHRSVVSDHQKPDERDVAKDNR
jgi:hypothetical protein